MICEVCHKKNADIIFKTVTGGQVATRAMCMECAHTMQQEMMKMFMSLGFRPEQVEEAAVKEESRVEMPRFICAECGRPFSHLDESTMAGCATCYHAMEDELAEHFNMDLPQGSMKETSSAAQAAEGDFIRELKYSLLQAVIREDFEEAALLRNQIQSLASGMGEQS